MKVSIEEQAMAEFGRVIGQACQSGSIVYLNGTLGMGKTTLSRCVVQGLGWPSSVKSPTYTLVEPYELVTTLVYHFDLYRLADPEELEFIGIRDYDTQHAIWLVEWPEKGAGMLPCPDIVLTLTDANNGRQIELQGHSERGEAQINAIKKAWEA
ncbi:MAG: tRNA threonylcarbamoyladenosine biosynthesis protein TsaE [Reinekea sp.]|uniref:tRNA (adenosine(37)-N6)-threonylcarbamoyltransferase complex ATPase subunit type 1 TsaE n=1 Tax=Reinekea sp. TaxID=1970455 RepID=UPI00398941FF